MLFLARRPIEPSAAKQMQMKMHHALPAVSACVYNQAEAIFGNALPYGKLLCNLYHIRHCIVIRVHYGITMTLWNYQYMGGRLWVYVVKGKHLIVLICFF